VNCLDWPPQNCGMNPIAQLFLHLKTAVSALEPRTVEKLKRAVTQVFTNFDQGTINALCDSFRRRVARGCSQGLAWSPAAQSCKGGEEGTGAFSEKIRGEALVRYQGLVPATEVVTFWQKGVKMAAWGRSFEVGVQKCLSFAVLLSVIRAIERAPMM